MEIVHYAAGTPLLARTEHKDPKGLVTLWRVFRACILDRTRTLHIPCNYRVLTPIPTVDPTFTKTFSQICLSTAEHLWQESRETGKHVSLYWSGGIDSTTALVALLRTAEPDDYERLSIVLSPESIDEYPLFYQKYIEGKIPTQMVDQYSVVTTLDFNKLMVTGELGDQIFGSVLIMPFIDRFSDVFEAPIKDCLEYMIELAEVNDSDAETIIEYTAELMKQCPFPVENFFDFAWWLNFSSKWQDVELRLFNGVKMTEAMYTQSCRHFFGTNDFQQWSMNEHNHRVNKIRRSPNSYKWTAKQFILDFTGDRDYFENKDKVGSLKGNNLSRKPKARATNFKLLG